jgi:hypothetical protein
LKVWIMGSDTVNNDYKYVLDSLSVLQLGSRFTYRELLDDIEISYKFRCIIKQHILQEVDADTTLESHLYYLSDVDESFRVYQQLKVKIRIYVRKKRMNRKGEEEISFEERTLTPGELVCLRPEQKKMMGIIIAELQLSKVGLMSFVV